MRTARSLFQRLRGLGERARWFARGSAAPGALDNYCASAPGPQNALDIFRGEWSSRLPGPLAHLDAGNADLFADPRLQWFLDQIGGVGGKTVLELGPLEGGHTYMLETQGAGTVTAIESNSRAFLKCLITKELLGLARARFLFGDFVEYLRQGGPTFEVCLASGVLYHMQNPAELIALLAKRCTGYLFIWTHYYDREILTASTGLAGKFTGEKSMECAGFRHSLYRQEYRQALGWSGFCGGNAGISHWMKREDILAALRHFGFEVVGVGFDDPRHPNGPAFALAAKRLAGGRGPSAG